MKIFNWLLNLLFILSMIAILMIVIIGLNGLRMKLNEFGQHNAAHLR